MRYIERLFWINLLLFRLYRDINMILNIFVLIGWKCSEFECVWDYIIDVNILGIILFLILVNFM